MRFVVRQTAKRFHQRTVLRAWSLEHDLLVCIYDLHLAFSQHEQRLCLFALAHMHFSSDSTLEQDCSPVEKRMPSKARERRLICELFTPRRNEHEGYA
eukprot:g62638.t1